MHTYKFIVFAEFCIGMNIQAYIINSSKNISFTKYLFLNVLIDMALYIPYLQQKLFYLVISKIV